MAFSDTPIDRVSREKLQTDGLRLDLVDTSDEAALSDWIQADMRGFYGPEVQQKQVEETIQRVAGSRVTGVWDETAAVPSVPVATVGSWCTELTVPGSHTIDAWAISSVTVAPTHRRRGIARALLESELRTARARGIPMAMLTVSESTLYGRYGFGAAAFAADLEIETRRVRWAGPETEGRLHFVSLAQAAEQARDIHERFRRQSPGEVEFDEIQWKSVVGVIGDAEGNAKHLRAVRYDAPDGEPQGFVVYKPIEAEADFTKHVIEVRHLAATTDAAYAALWHYLLSLDLVTTVKARLRSVDEPVFWQVGDLRAVHTGAVMDHQWLRILDVPAVLEARRYAVAGRYVLDVRDELGHADGRFALDVTADGSGTVTTLAAGAGAAAAAGAGADAASELGDPGSDVTAWIGLGVGELSSLYLGGVSAETLARAGRVTELAPGSAARLDVAFRADRAPWLSLWY